MIGDLLSLIIVLANVVLICLGTAAIGPTILGLLADGVRWIARGVCWIARGVCWIARGVCWIAREVLWRGRRRVVGPLLWDELVYLRLEHHAAQLEVDRIATEARRRIRRIAEAGSERRPGREVRR